MRSEPLLTIQYHSEACPGPLSNGHLRPASGPARRSPWRSAMTRATDIRRATEEDAEEIAAADPRPRPASPSACPRRCPRNVSASGYAGLGTRAPFTWPSMAASLWPSAGSTSARPSPRRACSASGCSGCTGAAGSPRPSPMSSSSSPGARLRRIRGRLPEGNEPALSFLSSIGAMVPLRTTPT